MGRGSASDGFASVMGRRRGRHSSSKMALAEAEADRLLMERLPHRALLSSDDGRETPLRCEIISDRIFAYSHERIGHVTLHPLTSTSVLPEGSSYVGELRRVGELPDDTPAYELLATAG